MKTRYLYWDGAQESVRYNGTCVLGIEILNNKGQVESVPISLRIFHSKQNSMDMWFCSNHYLKR